jgi:hypothetical protein
MTSLAGDIEGFVKRAGSSARRMRDGDIAAGMDPVWLGVEDSWEAFSKAVLRAPTAELKELFLEGWFSETEE